ncbi:glycosyltransferase family 2 protein [Candidatus Ruminimicrobiellum ovillum]|uniref:glycosyltransferase family 2 protein n=1 Tax=Candidatus Ruminimicrobiellum ovillum TaxID=1947927 RepID=UPI00355A50BD
MKTEPKITIIIPVYNTEQYLRQCLDSIVNQIFKEFECICINDCSTDNSYDILEEYAEKDDRFVIINLMENKGQGNARNEGIKIAGGKYITFVDSDDWVASDYLDVLHKAIEKYDTDFVVAKFSLFDNTTHKFSDMPVYIKKTFYNRIIYEKENKNIFLEKLGMQLSTVCANIFKKDFIFNNKMSFNVSIKMEDTLFMWEAIIIAHKFILIKNAIYYYRRNLKNSANSSLTIEDIIKYNEQLILLNKNKLKKYLPNCYTHILIEYARDIEKLPFEESKRMFVLIKKFIFIDECILNYNILNLRDKIRLFIFETCLKYNINYCFIGKLHRNFNPIRLFIKNQN